MVALKGRKVRHDQLEAGAVTVKCSFKVVFVSLILFATRALPLAREMRHRGGTGGDAGYFNIFCQPYLYLPFFLDQLAQMQPSVDALDQSNS